MLHPHPQVGLASSFHDSLLEAGLALEFDSKGSIGRRYRRQDQIGKLMKSDWTMQIEVNYFSSYYYVWWHYCMIVLSSPLLSITLVLILVLVLVFGQVPPCASLWIRRVLRMGVWHWGTVIQCCNVEWAWKKFKNAHTFLSHLPPPYFRYAQRWGRERNNCVCVCVCVSVWTGQHSTGTGTEWTEHNYIQL
jgi:hypothetical protein